MWLTALSVRVVTLQCLLWLSASTVAIRAADTGPFISGFAPSSGAVGAKITIEGENFGQTSDVQFSKVSADFTVFSDQQIIATVPPGATNGPITVVSLTGTDVSVTAFTVLMDETPRITGFAPVEGSVGTDVVISGEHFTGATIVSFNGVSAAFQVGFSGTDLVATVPAGAVTGPISVTTPAGNVTSGNAFTVTTTQPPEIENFSPNSGSVGTRVVINGNNFVGTSAVRFNGLAANFTLFGNTITVFVPEGATSGPITVVTPGGTRNSSSPFTVTTVGAPIITEIVPASARAGVNVTINGQNFDGATSVTFNGTPAEFSILGFSVFATVPAAATSGPVTVVTPKGTATSSTPFTVISPLAPEIVSFTPTAGDIGTVVTVTGTNFVGSTEVRFGGIAAQFTVDSGTKLRATVPPGAISGNVTVVTPSGAASGPEVFYVTPTIASFEPAFGSVGTAVTIRGANLSSALAVQFAGVSANFTSISAAEIRAVVPEGASSGPISVATPAGFASTENNFYLPPKITRFEPLSAPIGTAVTITGDNLLGVTSVRFGTVAAAITPVSVNALVATVPESAVNAPITVTAPGGSVTSDEIFYVGLYANLVVGSSVSPPSVGVGDFLSYGVSVTNRGPLEATSVTLTDRLPMGVELIFAPSGADCVVTDNIIRCNLGALAAGADVAIRFSVTVLDGPYLTNQVTAASTTSDPDLIDNSITLITALKGVEPPAQVTLGTSRTGSGLVLSWPVTAAGFTLESRVSLNSGIGWSAVNVPPVVINGNNTVTVTPNAQSSFYRLKGP